MSISFVDRNYIESVFPMRIIENKQLESNLPTEIYELLKNNRNLSTVKDSIRFFNRTTYRPYDSVLITYFIDGNLKISQIILDLVKNLTPPFLLYCDLHFICQFSDKSEKSESQVLKFQRASKHSAFNETIKIYDIKDYKDLKKEIKHKSNAEILNLAFTRHSDLFEYESSGMIPYTLINLVIHIQKVK